MIVDMGEALVPSDISRKGAKARSRQQRVDSCVFAPSRLCASLLLCAICSFSICGCSKPEYDTSTPDAALDSMYRMIADGRPELLGTLVYIPARDITFDDGVTEASAILNVTEK